MIRQIECEKMHQNNDKPKKKSYLKDLLMFSLCNLLCVFSASVLAQIFYLFSKRKTKNKKKTKKNRNLSNQKLISNESNEIIDNDIHLRNIFALCREVDRLSMFGGKLGFCHHFGFLANSPY